MRREKEENEMERDSLRSNLSSLNAILKTKEEKANLSKKDIENFMRERDLLSKDVVAAED